MIQTLALEALTGEALNRASSIVQAAKNVWASIGSAVLVSVFTQHTLSHAANMTASLPKSVLAHPASPQALAARMEIAARAGTSGLVDVSALLTASTALLVLIALFLPGRRARTSADAQEEAASSRLAQGTALHW